MTITSSDPQHFIPPDTRARSYVEANPSIPAIYLQLGGGADQMVTLVLDWGHNTKAGALAQLAEWVAAVEALPDDTHAGQGVLPTETLTRFCKYGDTIQKPCTHAECRPEYVPDLLGALDRSIQQARADRAAPVWRTLTFGDLRAGDVIKSDENGLQGTVIELGGIIAGSDGKERWVRSSIGGSYPRSGDPVLVRHPRPEVGQ